MKKLKIYLAFFKLKFLNEIQYKIAALAGILTQFAFGGMYIMLYAAFLHNGSHATYTIEQMATYTWLQQAFLHLFNLWTLDKDVLEQCETGAIAVELVRPINLYDIWHAKTLAKKLAMVALRILPILLICTMPFMGQYKLAMPVSITTFIFFIVTLILSVGLVVAYVMLLYGFTITTISAKGIKNTFQILMEFCSGQLIPIAFMPQGVINVLKLTPFYYMQNVAFNIYNGYTSDIKEIISIIALQLLWLFILTALGKKLINKQISQIVVQGG